MKPHVRDAHALVAYLEREPGYVMVADIFTQAAERDTPLLMTTVNMGEVLHMARRECGPEQVELVERTIAELPIEVVTVDMPLARRADNPQGPRSSASSACHSVPPRRAFEATPAQVLISSRVTAERNRPRRTHPGHAPSSRDPRQALPARSDLGRSRDQLRALLGQRNRYRTATVRRGR